MPRPVYHLFVKKNGNFLIFKLHVIEGNSPLLTEEDIDPHSVDFPKVIELVQHIETRLTKQALAPEEELQRLGGGLYDLVLPPELKEPLAAEKRDDCFLQLNVANMELAGIPWELLYTGKHFLCERFRVGRNLTNLAPQEQLRINQRKKMERSSLGALLISGDTRDLNSETELKTIKLLLDPPFKKFVRTEEKKRAEFLHQELKKGYEVVHFVGHSEYHADDPERTGWRCADGSILTSKRLEDTSAPDAVYPLLVFASSCESAHASDMASENAVGSMAEAFLKCGVPHYIGTIAKIPDADSCDFARIFYAGLIEKKSVGDALQQARETIRQKRGPGVWASYVHYGDPTHAIFADRHPFTPPVESPPPDPFQRRRRRRAAVGAIIGIVILTLFLGIARYTQVQDYFRSFPDDAFGIAVTPLVIRDLVRNTEGSESLLFPREIEVAARRILAGKEVSALSFATSIRSHEEAIHWGRQRGASVVLWGSAERGTEALRVRLRATRVILPERDHVGEPIKRFFLHMLFSEQFHDDQTYMTDFELEDILLDLDNLQAGHVLYDQATLLVSLIGGVARYSEGDYGAASRIFQTVVTDSSQSALGALARRWLVLSHLNARDYPAAASMFAELTDSGKEISNEDRIRLGFLRLAMEAFQQGVLPHLTSDWVEPLQEACVDLNLSPSMKGACAGMLSEGNRRQLMNDEPLGANLQRLLETAVLEAPQSYFLWYLYAMVTRSPDEAETALRRAEALNPHAAEPHFGRAILAALDSENLRAVLPHLDRAIQAEPSERDYWRWKLALLNSLRHETMWTDNREFLEQHIATAESFLQHGSDPFDLYWALGLLVEDYYDIGERMKALSALNQMVKLQPRFWKVHANAATLAMRYFGAWEDAERFLNKAEEIASGLPEEETWDLHWLQAELLLRRGSLEESVGAFYDVHFPVAGLRQIPLDRYIPLQNVIGNVLHAGGEYEAAERQLRKAKVLAMNRTPSRGSWEPAELGKLPENDYKWKWATTLDFGLVLLSEGRYSEAAQEFKDSAQHLVDFAPASIRPRSSMEPHVSGGGMVWLSKVCEGYAYFKDARYDLASRTWWSAQYPFVGVDPANIAERLDSLDNPAQAGFYRAYYASDPIFRLGSSGRFKEAISLIESKAPKDFFASALLSFYSSEKDFVKVEDVFRSLGTRIGGATSFEDPVRKLASSFHHGRLNWTVTAWDSDELEFFLPVITRDPEPEAPFVPDLTTWRDQYGIISPGAEQIPANRALEP